MRNVSTSVALSALVGLSFPLDVLSGDPAAAADELVVVEQVGERRFRLVNNSTKPLVYMQWLNQSKNPVPYCRYPDDSISICSRDRVVSDGKPALEEASLKPGKSIVFDVVRGKAVAVGVRLLLEGEERLLWHEL